MQLTWYDSNSWLIELAGQKILLDPWLVGSLTFGNTPWLFKGDRPQPLDIPDQVDLILLSQGLEDHAHPPTLKVLDKTWPVVGSPKAAEVVTTLGYQTVTGLAHDQKFVLNDRVEIWALPGSPIGPTLVENAYVITDLQTGIRLYYEPHGFHSDQVKRLGSIDVVLTPIIGISILGLLPVLNGQKTTLELCQAVTPQAIVPTSGAAELTYEGLLTKVLRLEGNLAEFRQLLTDHGLSAQVLEPQVGIPLNVPLQMPTTLKKSSLR
ncbi:MAG: MBL fold metallo-hydrolase [Synechocystis sp.]|nr:MBL fold metallo-hydrolase [Synechocystis sp.]